MMIAARNSFLMGGAGPTPWQNPYVTDGLVAMWDGEWNARGGAHGDESRIVDTTGNCADLVLSSGVLTHASPSGLECAEAAVLSCADNAPVNSAVQAIVYDSSKSVTIQLICALAGVSARANIELASVGTIGRNYPCFLVNCEKIPTVSILRSSCKSCSTSHSQSDAATSVYPVACCQMSMSGGMIYQSRISIDFGATEAIGNATTATLAGRLPNESNLVSRCITSGVVSLTMPAGAIFLSSRVYSRALTADEVAANYAIDAARFGL